MAFGEAPQELVQFAHLKHGMQQPDPYEAYQAMKPVAGDILALGLTVEQLAAAFGETVENAQNTLDRWFLLDQHSTAIEEYGALRAQLEGLV